MSLFVLLIPACIGVVLDLSFFSTLDIFGAHPSASLALLAVWSVLRPREEAMVLAPAMGVLLGLFGNEPVGASVIGLAPVVLLAALRDPSVTEGRTAAALTIAFAGAAAYVLVLAIAEAAAFRLAPGPISTLRHMLGAAVLTSALAGVLYWPMTRAAWQPYVRGQFRRY